MRYGTLNGGGTDEHEDGSHDSGLKLLCTRRAAACAASPLLLAGTLLAFLLLVLPEKRGGDVARTELSFDLLTAAYHARCEPMHIIHIHVCLQERVPSPHSYSQT